MFLPTNITLKLGDSGDFVAELQRRLSMVHCYSGDTHGFYDGLTVNAVSQFQSMHGIRADGIAGPETLRRLNGVISGDNSSTDDHKAAEEEAQRRQQQDALLLQQQMVEEQRLEQQRLAEQQFAQQQQATPTYMPATEYHAYAPPPPVAPEPISYAAQPMQQPVQYAPPPPPTSYAPPPQYPPGELLAQTQQGAAQHQAHLQQGQTQSNQPPHLAGQLQQPLTQEQLAQQNTGAPEQGQQRGIVGRAMQYANEMVQKLANYFESKLPKHVIAEVKELGHVMANSGVKEAAIPTGPEQQRGIEGQSRGQQQGKQIG